MTLFSADHGAIILNIQEYKLSEDGEILTNDFFGFDSVFYSQENGKIHLMNFVDFQTKY